MLQRISPTLLCALIIDAIVKQVAGLRWNTENDGQFA